jgi:hypothetical protein
VDPSVIRVIDRKILKVGSGWKLICELVSRCLHEHSEPVILQKGGVVSAEEKVDSEVDWKRSKNRAVVCSQAGAFLIL